MTAPDLPTLRSLLSRLEAATGPDWELDGDICVALGYRPEWVERGGNTWQLIRSGAYLRVDGTSAEWEAPALTASIDAAVALVERMLPSDWEWVASKIWGDGYSAQLMCEPHLVEVEKAPSPAIALCTALVKALIAGLGVAGLTDREKETDNG